MHPASTPQHATLRGSITVFIITFVILTRVFIVIAHSVSLHFHRLYIVVLNNKIAHLFLITMSVL